MSSKSKRTLRQLKTSKWLLESCIAQAEAHPVLEPENNPQLAHTKLELARVNKQIREYESTGS